MYNAYYLTAGNKKNYERKSLQRMTTRNEWLLTEKLIYNPAMVYAKATHKNGWSRDQLKINIKNNYHLR